MTPSEFWNQFNRTSSIKKKSIKTVLKNIFTQKQEGDLTKNISNIEAETSFSEELNNSTCPPGLYCVIDEFLTDYDLRLLEEEERAKVVATKR